MVKSSAGLFVCLLLSVPVFAQGKLSAVRDATASRDPRSPTTDDRTCDDNNTLPTDDTPVRGGASLSDGILGPQAAPYMGLFYGGLALWAVPNAILDAGWERPAYFGPYPYAAANTGPLHVDPPRSGTGYEAYVRPFTTQPFSFRGSVEQGSDFRHLQRTGLRLFIDGEDRLGLRTHWDYYRERLPTGKHDFTWFGDLSLLFRFVQNDTVLMHTGLGVKTLLDRRQDEYGVNVLYGIDLFPLQPLHLSASIEGGTIGRAGFLRLRAEAGVNYQRFQAIAGYDFLRVATVNLYGPFIGLRVWY